MNSFDKKAYMKKYRQENRSRILLKQKEYRDNHKEERNANTKKWRLENKGRIKEYNKEYRGLNKEDIKVQRKGYCLSNQDKRTAAQARRNAAKKQRTPKWANLRKIAAWYKVGNRLGLEVDHVIPLQGRMVSGLHVHTNMQLLSRTDNSTKGNR